MMNLLKGIKITRFNDEILQVAYGDSNKYNILIEGDKMNINKDYHNTDIHQSMLHNIDRTFVFSWEIK